MTKAHRRILLLTDVFPCDNYSGALMSSQLCRFLLEQKCELFCITVKNKAVKEDFDDYLRNEITTLEFEKPNEGIEEKTSFDSKITTIVNDSLIFIKDHHIDTIWCPLQGEALLKVYAGLQKNLKDVKFITQIWDPFEWVIHDLNYPPNKKKELLLLFDKVIKKSDSILAASKPMANHYQTKYKKPSFPIFTSYTITEHIKHQTNKNQFTIVISGQTYATTGINSLLEALDQLNWKCNHKKIVIEYFGSKPEPFNNHLNHVHLNGYVDQKTLVNAEINADLLYCSYFFNHSVLDVVRQQSYPSKIITYIPSQVPILIHSKPDSPVYQDFKKFNCGYLLDTTDTEAVKNKLTEIITDKKVTREKYVKNAVTLFNKTFTKEKNQANLFKAFGITEFKVGYKVLEVNNIDTFGRAWNGFDIANYLNGNTNNLALQICTDKFSGSKTVVELYNDPSYRELEYYFTDFENNHLSTQLCLSVSSQIMKQKKVFKNADLVHYHLIHNMRLSLFSLIEFCNEKPTVISIHDPWFFTGHCVHYYDCNGWLTGCSKCKHLNYYFPMKKNHCHEMWKLKKYVYENIDADFVVSTKYMYDLFKASPLTENKRVHLIPFGIDVNKFTKVSQDEARKKYHIPKDHIVLFHRAQTEFKGTNYYVEALKALKTSKKITILSCGEKHHFDSVKNLYNVIDLGVIGDEELEYAYNACDIFIMPSIGESFGMMAIEAMSCKKPVICFNNTALPSVTFAPDCGIAVENLNSKKLMEAIKYLIEDDAERLHRGELAREIVEKNYDVKDYMKKMDSLYQEVSKRKRSEKPESKEYTDTDDVVRLKKTLNSLTKILLPTKYEEYDNLIYKIPRRVKRGEIEYSDRNVQLLLEEYDEKATKIYRKFKESNFVDPRIRKRIMKKLKITKELIIHDRKKLINLIKKRIKKEEP